LLCFCLLGLSGQKKNADGGKCEPNTYWFNSRKFNRETIARRLTAETEHRAFDIKQKINYMKNIINTTCTLLSLVVVLSACQSELTTSESSGAVASESNNINVIEPIQNIDITVYKSPTCGCCKEWFTYL